MLNTPKPEPIRSPLIEEHAASAGIRHGFFTREGGVSSGIYASLNVGIGSQDDREDVLENRARVAAALGVAPDHLVTLHQCHSADAVVVDEPLDGPLLKADALVTNTPGLALGALAADCGPVLFADPKARVIAAAHAGWKGALTGVLESAIEAMEGLGAKRENIVATLGPSISQENYEVGPEFVDRFTAEDKDNAVYFRPSGNPERSLFDLNTYTLDRLKKAGVAASMLGLCTYADEERFYSYRRATHRGEPDYGRQISAIALETI
ncbi:peptidoglycan editing factor PgeF [Nitratireductor basaltis]|uniref:Purine nucleoside phosphorylase n=1 Tax=Nitratireductor basaltis TaxID=472175 RepID=A0A084U960_9HYPH|nr:peptidoglycan editing factor PgeF [Nitratireductor basaltis]KFB09496.1 Polyphenol oxidase [Nitratireductor basaltis]